MAPSTTLADALPLAACRGVSCSVPPTPRECRRVVHQSGVPLITPCNRNGPQDRLLGVSDRCVSRAVACRDQQTSVCWKPRRIPMTAHSNSLAARGDRLFCAPTHLAPESRS